MLAVDDLVLLEGPQAYRGCLGVAMGMADGHGADAAWVVYVQGLGTVVRRASDLRVLTIVDIEAGVEWTTAKAWTASVERSSCVKAMEAAIAMGNTAAAEAYADRVVAAEEAMDAS